MGTIHALLVGINDYHPDSGVSSLDGCVNDIKGIKAFIEETYENASIKQLENHEATREAVIENFHSVLIDQAEEGDTALFYYAGHGSFNDTDDVFKKFDPLDQDETFVCYDSRCEGKYDLADKEMAVLLSRFKEGVHVVVIADSCHSASSTRNIAADLNLGKKRFTARRTDDNPRPLGHYLLQGDNYYADMLQNKGTVSIPKSKHILLSACDRDQEAQETLDGKGLFSSNLLQNLKKNHHISYSDIFAKVRQSITVKTNSQLPTIAPMEGFNPNKVFLSGNVATNDKRHIVRFHKGSWRLAYGAINGLPTTQSEVEKIKVAVYPPITSDNRDELIEIVDVSKVLLKEAVLDFTPGNNAAKNYRGEIVNFPGAMVVRIKGTATDITTFNALYEQKPSAFLMLDNDAIGAKYSLDVSPEQLVIRLTQDDSIVHGIKTMTGATIDHVITRLEQIEEWERLTDLQNEKTNIQDAIEFEFEYTDQSETIRTPGPALTLDYPHNEVSIENSVPYALIARNTSNKDLYIALLHLSATFGIYSLYGCQKLPKQVDSGDGDEGWIVLSDDNGMVVDDGFDEVTDTFKLLVSTEEFDDYKFHVEDIEEDPKYPWGEIVEASVASVSRGSIRRGRKKDESDWCTKSIVVNTIRTKDNIQEGPISFSDNKITIKGHPSFRATVAFAPEQPATRSIHPHAMLANIFDTEGMEIVNLSKSKTRSTRTNGIIELSGITNEESLKENPLEIEIDEELNEDEYIIPVSFDGEFILPFGRTTKEGDKTVISIHELPSVPDEKRKRSLKKAAWFCLLKTVGFRNKAFLLRKARINFKDELVREEVTKKHLEKVKKILLVIHGIIGDTKDSSQSLMPLVDRDNPDKYDIMLTYDYENLREPIEGSAVTLGKLLNDLGIGKDDPYEVDIVCHSMGGLVSRHFIESVCEGDNTIDRLFMLGTPNGGSPFGDIPQYIEMVSTLLTVAANYGKPLLGPVLAYLNGLNTFLKVVGKVTFTLDQMSEDNKFIKDLARPGFIPSTQYFTIAGDIHQFQSDKEKNFGKFIEDVLLKVGDAMNRKEPNDIAVAVEAIHHIPEKIEHKAFTVGAHHMNYFIDGPAMEELKKII